ncbi:chitooligosaccharidolytic beta-N-acetylglucosaminidase [Harmonia axyridis]|uniref:chitooligosaccharidolytic beta-N-acetylglucosaminidase n=1 Tax=Harmonia axyridis TaxID=115357 RepID=UPI001E279A9E|nr:chitooligosaccharidolytic beta-N-acetylglucosaminidase [Harmonia axyridis]XP_045460913.1 chitooligosaccharidolytic beta-N-acetylglucosaminidase [Harmonia axyridis]XP_045460914.1 chitooligosaccharidolytic beta-N-acetylglucosaminidase [Harmonia axyridis]
MKIFILFCFLGIEYISALSSPWSWECKNERCTKKEILKGEEEKAVSLEACQMYCSRNSGLWPKPTGKVDISNNLVPLNPSQIEINSRRTSPLTAKAAKLFKEDLISRIATTRDSANNDGKPLSINIFLTEPDTDKLTLETDESYNLILAPDDKGKVQVNITAPNFYGSRHGLETLGQLIIYDDLRNKLMVPSTAYIVDKPAYPYRGILLDTSRNYISVDAIKKTINGMAASKLNTFHWHITDSHSFPYVSKSRPELSLYGAYSPKKVYTEKDIEEIVDFAKSRGVRVMPEFDAPAHVGEGWQKTGYVICLNAQPWGSYCVEPPCGQFDVTKDGLYDALEDIYGDMVDQFDPDIFHMGGDEVHFTCWNNTKSITDWMAKKGWGREEKDFAKLWGYFQDNAVERLFKKTNKNIPIIMWTSTLTKKEHIAKYLPKDKYIIQIWTTGSDPQIDELLSEGYKLILSNYDALYLDCGFAGWVTDGNNWCSPYIGWQKVYDNNPRKIAGSKVSQILGSEAALWTEQVDSTSVDSRLWPRAAAMAETLWSDPQTSWREAESRFLIHRERLVRRGIDADALEPEWCLQNENECPINKV